MEKDLSDDQRLEQAVIDELNCEPSVNSAGIGVTAISGVVTHTSHLESYVERDAAEAAAKRVKAVAGPRWI